MQTNTTVAEPKNTPKRFSLWLVIIVGTLAFVAGTRSEELIRLVGPVVGINVASQSIDLSSVEETYNALSSQYAGKLDTQKLIYGANKGLVAAAGDRYTVFLDPNDADDLNKELSGDIGAGIGAEIAVRNNSPTVVRNSPNNPAASSGLRVGDVIAAINNQSSIDWDATQAAEAIRGDEDTTVKLTVKRNDKSKQTISITRKKIDNPSVYGSIKNGVGTMTITRFDAETGQLAAEQASRFTAANVSGVIVDVRNDGGGYLDAAIETASLWLDDKVVVEQRGKNDSNSVLRSNKGQALLKDTPTVVLVNGGTASASEILAGALRDNKKAQLVGEKTFGKGSVQELVPLANGSKLKVTIAHWYTPSGVNVGKAGLKPDVKVDLTKSDANDGKDPQRSAAVRTLDKL